jgi:hypothetical protein
MLTQLRQRSSRAAMRCARTIGTATLALCIALLPACGSGDGPSGPGDDGNSPRTAVPDELVGQWYSGNVSPTDYYNPNTGSWSGAGYGEGVLYKFTRDGHYEFAFQLTSRLYDCYTLTQSPPSGSSAATAVGATATRRSRTMGSRSTTRWAWATTARPSCTPARPTAAAGGGGCDTSTTDVETGQGSARHSAAGRKRLAPRPSRLDRIRGARGRRLARAPTSPPASRTADDRAAGPSRD